jgi:6-phosphogluconate dehydrogenase (decarboxylating)
MKSGIVGLQRMGLNLGKLAVERGHEVVAGDPKNRHGSRLRMPGCFRERAWSTCRLSARRGLPR